MAERSISVRLSARVEGYLAAMAAAQKATGVTAAQIGKIEATGKKLQGVGRTMTTFITAPLTAMAAGSVMAAMSWESAWAGVTKTVDGTAEQMSALEQGLRDMAKELPATHGEIAAVAEAAGQLGVGVDDIEEFTRVMIDLGETTNLSADEAATALARFMNIMGTSQDNVSNLGSTIVDLGNNFATTEAEITEMGGRLAAAGRQAGLSESDVLGFATALTSVGVNAEAGGTAFSKVFTSINDAVIDGGDNLETFARVAGLSTEQFRAAFEQNAAGTIAMFIDGMGAMAAAGQSTTGVFDDLELSDQRLMRSVLSLGQAQGLLTEALDTGASAWASNTALAAEATKRYDTTAAQFEMVRNKIVDLFIDLGEMLLPVVAAVVDALGGLAEMFQGLPQPIQMAVLALGGLAAAGGPVIFMAGSLMRNWTLLTKTMRMSNGVFLANNLALAGLGAVAFAGLMIHQKYYESQRKTKENTQESTAALLQQFPALMGAALAAREAGEEIDSVAVANEALSRSLAEGNEDLAQSLAHFNLGAADALRMLIITEEDASLATYELVRAMGEGSDVANLYRRSIEEWLSTGEFISDETLAAADAMGVTEEQFRSTTDALRDYFTAASRSDSQGMAKAFLDTQVSIYGFEESLVAAAEAAAGMDRQTGDSVAIFQEYAAAVANASDEELQAAGITDEMMAALATLDPAAMAAALGMDELGSSAGGMAEEVDAASIVVKSAAERMTEATEKFQDDWSAAIDSVIDESMRLYDAEQQLWDVAQGFGEAIDDNSRSLALNEKEGRQNADAVQEWAQGIVEHTQAMIDSGASALDVANDYHHNREALLDQAEAAGFDREAVDDLISSWGLMPDMILTTYNMTGITTAREQVQSMLDELGVIDDMEVAAEIQALIDQGKYEEAIAYLDALANPIRVPVEPYAVGLQALRGAIVGAVSGINARVGFSAGIRSAAGRYVPGGSNIVSSLGELGGRRGDEVVLPLGDRAGMAKFLAMPEVGPRVWSAMASMYGGMGQSSGTSYQVDVVVNNNGRELSGDDIALAIRRRLVGV